MLLQSTPLPFYSASADVPLLRRISNLELYFSHQVIDSRVIDQWSWSCLGGTVHESCCWYHRCSRTCRWRWLSWRHARSPAKHLLRHRCHVMIYIIKVCHSQCCASVSLVSRNEWIHVKVKLEKTFSMMSSVHVRSLVVSLILTLVILMFLDLIKSAVVRLSIEKWVNLTLHLSNNHFVLALCHGWHSISCETHWMKVTCKPLTLRQLVACRHQSCLCCIFICEPLSSYSLCGAPLCILTDTFLRLRF